MFNLLAKLVYPVGVFYGLSKREIINLKADKMPKFPIWMYQEYQSKLIDIEARNLEKIVKEILN